MQSSPSGRGARLRPDNDFVLQADEAQIFGATIRVLAGGCTPLDERHVLILAPPPPVVIISRLERARRSRRWNVERRRLAGHVTCFHGRDSGGPGGTRDFPPPALRRSSTGHDDADFRGIR